MSMRLFTEDHEWLDIDGDIATVGVTDFAQGQLGDLVFVELPEIDAELSKGDDAAVVESVKAAGEVYSPATGTVVGVNEALEDDPELVNTSPEGEGWIFKLKLSDMSQVEGLMTEAQYKASLDV